MKNFLRKKEAYDVTEDDIEDKEIKEDDDENIENLINEKMRQYYDKTINTTKNKSQEKNTRNRKNK